MSESMVCICKHKLVPVAIIKSFKLINIAKLAIDYSRAPAHFTLDTFNTT